MGYLCVQVFIAQIEMWVFLAANTQNSSFQSDFSLKKFRLQPLKRDRQSYQLFNKDNSLLGTGMIMKVITNGVLAD